MQGAVSAAGERAAADMLAAALSALERAYAAALAAADTLLPSRGAAPGGRFAHTAVVFMAGQAVILRAALGSCAAWAALAEQGAEPGTLGGGA